MAQSILTLLPDRVCAGGSMGHSLCHVALQRKQLASGSLTNTGTRKAEADHREARRHQHGRKERIRRPEGGAAAMPVFTHTQKNQVCFQVQMRLHMR